MRARDCLVTPRAILGLGVLVNLVSVSCRLDNQGVENTNVERPPPDAGSRQRPTVLPTPDSGAAPVVAPTLDALTEPASADAAAPAADGATIAADARATDTRAAAPLPPGLPAACAALPTAPITVARLGQGPRGDDFTFGTLGAFIALHNQDVVRWTMGLGLEALTPNAIGTRGGALRVVQGDLYLADRERNTVLRVGRLGPAWAQPARTVAPMKMVLGPAGAMFVTGQSGDIFRVDGASGAVTTVASAGTPLGGLTFSRDYRTLYVAATAQNALLALSAQADGWGPPQTWHDQIPQAAALTTDACGSVYAVSENDGRIWRISAAKGVETLATTNEPNLRALSFGSGQQGWDERSLYVLDAVQGRIFQLSVGVAAAPAPSN